MLAASTFVRSKPNIFWKFLPFWFFLIFFKFGASLHYTIISPLGEKLSVKMLRSFPEALQRRCLKKWLAERKIEDVSFEDVEAMRGMLEKEKPAKINLSRGKFCRRKEGFLFIAEP